MRISVVIPTYNRRATLPRALDSVLAQTLPAVEIIVVDDGSTDGTGEWLATAYPRVRLLRQPNRGVSAARNAGIAAAEGDWIALLDSDDAWLPAKLDTQAKAIAARPGHRLCHTEEIWIRDGKRVNAMKKHAKCGGRIFRQCLPLCVISPSAALLDKHLLQEHGGFDEHLPACEDYDLWLKVCAREPVLFVATPQIVKYGGHSDQLSRRHWGMDRFRVHALDRLIAAEVLGREDRRAAVETLMKKARILVNGANKRGNHDLAAEFQAYMDRYVGSIGTGLIGGDDQ